MNDLMKLIDSTGINNSSDFDYMVEMHLEENIFYLTCELTNGTDIIKFDCINESFIHFRIYLNSVYKGIVSFSDLRLLRKFT